MRIEALNVLCNVTNGKNKEHSDYIYIDFMYTV